MGTVGNGIIIRKNGVGQYGNFSYHFHPWICYSLYFEKNHITFYEISRTKRDENNSVLIKKKNTVHFFF